MRTPRAHRARGPKSIAEGSGSRRGSLAAAPEPRSRTRGARNIVILAPMAESRGIGSVAIFPLVAGAAGGAHSCPARSDLTTPVRVRWCVLKAPSFEGGAE